jgi:beta-N-acetylhexosaminidase
MNIEELAGQVIIGSIRGTTYDKETAKEFERCNIGALFLSPKNMPDVDSLRALTTAFQASRGTREFPALISCDQEGGRIQPLPTTTTNFPSAAVIGYTQDEEMAFNWALLQGETLRSLGINMTFSPCLDVLDSEDNRVVGSRSFGDDANVVASLGKAALRGLRRSGVVGVAKHYPGHGASGTDPHYGSSHVVTPKEKLWEKDLLPFRVAVKARVPAIMTCHAIYDDIDPRHPGTCSYLLLTGLLRRRIGFRGVIISDALVMDSIAKGDGVGAGAVAFLQAGGDLIEAHDSWQKVYAAVVDAAKKGTLSSERLVEAAHRVGRLRARSAAMMEHSSPPLDEETRREILNAIAMKARASGAPLDEDMDPNLLPGTARRYHLREVLQEVGAL